MYPNAVSRSPGSSAGQTVGVRVQAEVVPGHARRPGRLDVVELGHVEALELEPPEVVRPLPPAAVGVRAGQLPPSPPAAG